MRTKVKEWRIEFLRSIRLFRGFSDRELARIDGLMDDVDVPAGHVLMREGDVGTESYIVVSGEAEVILRGKRVGMVGPGAVVGEIAMLDYEPRSATVRALTPMQLLVVGRSAFSTFLNQPGVAVGLLRIMAARLRGVQARNSA